MVDGPLVGTGAHDPCVEVARVTVRRAGTDSVMFTFVAEVGPELVSTLLYVIVWRALPCFPTRRSSDLTLAEVTTVAAFWAQLSAGFGSGSAPWAQAELDSVPLDVGDRLPTMVTVMD